MFKYKFLALALIAIVLSIVVLKCSERGSGAKAAALAAAIAHARITLPSFKERVEHPLITDRAFFVRASFKDSAGNMALLWLKRVEIAPAGYKGIVDEDPFNVAGVHRGDQVTVPDADVVDWAILLEDGTKEGALTQGLEPGH